MEQSILMMPISIAASTRSMATLQPTNCMTLKRQQNQPGSANTAAETTTAPSANFANLQNFATMDLVDKLRR